MTTISLEGMEFYSFHGCTEDEKKVGIWFKVDVKFETDTIKAQASDQIADTINYQKVYTVIAKEMQIASNLLENVAFRIKNSLLIEFGDLQNLKIKISKISPPLGGKIKKVSVEI